MKKAILLPVLISSLLISQSLWSQINDQAIISHKAEVENFRNFKNQQFVNPGSSPLTSEQIGKFRSLTYFPIDYKYRIDGIFVKSETETRENLNLSGGGKIELMKVGNVTFKFENRYYELAVYRNNNLPEFADKSQLFIPFSDKTTGNETATGGRYLPVDAPSDGNNIVIDFNRAINPYGAYNGQQSTILAPPGNGIGFSVVSGERKYEDR